MPILSWLTREQDVKAADGVPYRLLERDDALSHGDPDSGNMLIQGDNLEALKALLPYYRGQVKCIYIDPPYNTRSAFEHYDDNLEHSRWLAMMWPRLELLRELLAEDGSIWVSIDDNEGHYLKVIMDEVFGRENYLTSFIWQKVDSPNENQSKITPDHEYVHVYGNERALDEFHRKPDLSLLDAYPGRCENGARYRDRLLKKNGKASLRSDRPSMFFEIEGPDGKPVLPIHDDGREARWSLGKETVAKLVADDELIWKERERLGERVWVPYTREWAPKNPVRPHPTILLDVKTSRQAKAHQRDVLPGVQVFDTVKPEQLLLRVLQICTKSGDLVLDSFLGSGTTAAVAHKMGRRWIGVEMGDHAHTHCVPRLKKVIEGEQGGISEAVEWKGGGGFAFYRLGGAVFAPDGTIAPGIKFAPLAAHIWFAETGTPMAGDTTTPFLGTHDGTGIALLYNGILGDKSVAGGNVLTRTTLGIIREAAGEFDGPLIIYGEASRIGPDALKREGITFKQTPYDVKAR
ncbi:MAG: site-specific DNA-methyltransferase [Parvularcula sp.]|nr:site-specific DNA-methyltransferase [Parvularcula sp.]